MQENSQETVSGAGAGRSGVDRAEVARFAALAAEWWDPDGPFKPLHRINPLRLTYIRDQLAKHFRRDKTKAGSLQDLAILDIGCGGGLVCEPLTRLGARMTGIDPAEETIRTAAAHAEAAGLPIDYRATNAGDLAAAGARFDAVLALEVVEHVDDVAGFVGEIAGLLKPGGLVVFSTINKTWKSYALAIVAAEYVLRWVPAGTHRWDRFVPPGALAQAARLHGLSPKDTTGMVYHPLADEWRLSRDTDVNYFFSAAKRS